MQRRSLLSGILAVLVGAGVGSCWGRNATPPLHTNDVIPVQKTYNVAKCAEPIFQFSHAQTITVDVQGDSLAFTRAGGGARIFDVVFPRDAVATATEFRITRGKIDGVPNAAVINFVRADGSPIQFAAPVRLRVYPLQLCPGIASDRQYTMVKRSAGNDPGQNLELSSRTVGAGPPEILIAIYSLSDFVLAFP